MNDAERFFAMAPAPGSKAALDLGCRCDAVANCGDDGEAPTESERAANPDLILGNKFTIARDCPLHWATAADHARQTGGESWT